MNFSRKKVNHVNSALKIDGPEIDEVIKTKFLGVIIDNKTTWKDHINYIAGKVSRGIGMILKARKFLKKEALMTLYFSFIYPYLTYCNQLWGATYVSNLRKLEKLQNKIVRIICNAKTREHIQPLYKSLGLLKLIDINKYLVGRFMFRVCNHLVPSLLRSFFKYNYELHGYDTRTAKHFHASPVRSDLGKTGIRYRGAVIWNSIETSEAIFVKFLKKVLDAIHV